jgi:Protein of unknown function DUF262
MAKRGRKAHAEIDDDFELDLDEEIEDETEKEGSGKLNFSITSYGADYPVDNIVKRLTSDAFFVPTFQRKFVWSQRHASRFIESLLMGLPVPGIFLYKDAKTSRHLVVDGQQRLRALQFFYEGIFAEARKFRLIGVRDEWEGKTYKDLTSTEQLKLDDSIVHATIFQQDEPKDQQKSLYFVFERINSGGMRLSPQEIRNCVSESPIIDVVSRVRENDSLEPSRACAAASSDHRSGHCYRKKQFLQPIQTDLGRPVPPEKIFRFIVTPNHPHLSSAPPHTRGVSRSSPTLGA